MCEWTNRCQSWCLCHGNSTSCCSKLRLHLVIAMIKMARLLMKINAAIHNLVKFPGPIGMCVRACMNVSVEKESTCLMLH